MGETPAFRPRGPLSPFARLLVDGWACAYCGGLRHGDLWTCPGCGAPRMAPAPAPPASASEVHVYLDPMDPGQQEAFARALEGLCTGRAGRPVILPPGYSLEALR